MLAAAILAAGESRRMGEPKALLDYHGKTFAEHLVDVATHPRIGVLRVVLGAKAEEIRARLGSIDPTAWVVNREWQSGQLSSIHAAIRSLPANATEAMMVCPVDHPIISREIIAALISAFDQSAKSIVVPVHRGRRGHPVIFRANLYSELLAASPEFGARQVVWSHSDDIEQVPTDEEGVVMNLDDPNAYRNGIKQK